jgi:adenine-specific DNA-methyltransferase
MNTNNTELKPMQKLEANSPEAQSADLVAANIEQLKALFPELITEGANGVAVNVDVLKTLVGDQTATDAEEKYGLNWHGKRRARQLALTPSTGTLRPCPNESVDWDTTKNLMIEGDNLEVLKLLQKSYAGKVKLIYIDPPYNTGKDFVYPDNFQDTIKSYLQLTGQLEGGQKISSNTDASGRFHTDWLSMVYPRLKLARGLLRNDGVILISIDDRELANLRAVCNEVFGEENLIGVVVWKGATDNNPTQIAVEHEYILCYCRSKEFVDGIWKNKSEDAKQVLLEEYERLSGMLGNKPDDIQRELRGFIRTHRESLAAVTHYDRVDEEGVYTGSRKVHNPKPGGYKYDVEHPVTKRVCVRPVNGYRYPEPRMKELIAAKRILFGEDETQIVQIKEYLADYEGKLSSVVQLDSRTGSNELNTMFGVQKLFSNPKPVALLKGIFEFIAKPGDLVLDFFAGSGSTAQAILELNALDAGARRYALVQLPEPLDPEDKDQRVGSDFCDSIGKPRTIAELTKERLRLVAAKLQQDTPATHGDVGFKVFKLDQSNLRAWQPNVASLEASLFAHQDHLLEGRTESDVLYELLLKLGIDLCVGIEQRNVQGKAVHAVGGGVLMACLATSISATEVEAVALGIVNWHKELAPAGETTCVFRDSAFADDVAKTNMAAILNQHGIQNVRSL